MQLIISLFFLASFGYSQNTLGDNYGGFDYIQFSEPAAALYLVKKDSITIYNFKNSSWETKKLDIDPKFNFEQFMPINVGTSFYLIQSLGGLVYELDTNFRFKRIDKSFKHKMQIASSAFAYKDKIYRYGGYGFWSMRNFSTYFDPITHEWEPEVATNSSVFPKGSFYSHTAIIDDELYIYGGQTLNQNNPLVYIDNDELWKYNFISKAWYNLGPIEQQKLVNTHIIKYKDKEILIDKYFVKVVDFPRNKIRFYKLTPIQEKLDEAEKLNSFYYKGIFYCFEHVYAVSNVQLFLVNEEDFFGDFVKEEQIYNTSQTKNRILEILGFFAFVLSLYLARKWYMNRNRIFVKKDSIIYKGKSYEFDEVSRKVLELFLDSESNVKSEDLLAITENVNLHYAHNTKVKNKIIENINFKLKSILGIEQDLITVTASEIDKRIKVYTLDKSFFVLK